MAGKNPIVFKVNVKSSSGNVYVVSHRLNGSWGCSCPGWIYHTPRKDCKHITQVKEHEDFKRKVNDFVFQSGSWKL